MAEFRGTSAPVRKTSAQKWGRSRRSLLTSFSAAPSSESPATASPGPPPRKKAAGKDPAAFRTTVTVCGEKPPLSCHLEPWFLSSSLGIKMRFLRFHPITPLLGMRVTLWKELFRILPYLVTRIPVLGFRARLFGQVAQRWCWPTVLFFARRSIASPENSIHWGKNAQTRAKPGECITIGKPRSPIGLEAFIRQRLVPDTSDLYADTHRQVDRLFLPLVLEYTGGNQNQAARLLGIARQTLRQKLRDLGLHVTQLVEADEDNQP
jgi:DNA-binding protein Fis